MGHRCVGRRAARRGTARRLRDDHSAAPRQPAVPDHAPVLPRHLAPLARNRAAAPCEAARGVPQLLRPLSLLALLSVWAIGIVLAFGMVQWAAGSALAMTGGSPGFGA